MHIMEHILTFFGVIRHDSKMEELVRMSEERNKEAFSSFVRSAKKLERSTAHNIYRATNGKRADDHS